MLENKIIVITGASSGVGKETAFRCAAGGAETVLLSRSEENLMSICKEIRLQKGRADYFILDVSDRHAVEATFKSILSKYGRIDILINCAGFGIFETLVSSKIEDAERMFAVNVTGLISCTKAVLPQMIERHEGHIVNIASIAGKLPTAKSSVYSATKHAIVGFSNALRLEIENKGVQVTVINPGPIRTPFFKKADPKGDYASKIDRFMLDAGYVADRIIRSVEEGKREIDLPWYMGLTAKLYQLFPRTTEKFGARWMKMK